MKCTVPRNVEEDIDGCKLMREKYGCGVRLTCATGLTNLPGGGMLKKTKKSFVA